MDNKVQNHGLVLNPAVTTPDAPDRHYVLGGYSGIFNKPVLMPGGHGWQAYTPVPELQSKNGLETMNCSNYGTYNAWETVAKFKGFSDFPSDCSERYSGVGTGTTASGNDPHYVAETIRKVIGAIPESFLPFNSTIDTWEKYYSPKPMYGEYLEMGKVIIEKFDLGHEWVILPGSILSVPEKAARVKAALEYGPLCVSVLAWKQRSNGLYFKNPGETDSHWVEIVDFVDGVKWIVLDHYDNTHKELEWLYDFGASKIYYIDRKAAVAQPTFGWYVWAVLIDRIKKGYQKLLGALS